MCHSVNWHKTSAVVCQQTHPYGRKNWKQRGLRGPFPPPIGLQPGCAVREHDKVMQVVLHGWKFISLKWADLLKRYMSGAGRKYSQPTLCSALCAQCQSLDLLTPWKHWCCWWRAACPLPTAPWHSQPPACACLKHFLAKSCFSSRNGASNFCHCALCLHGTAPTHNIQLPVTAPYYQPNSINSTDKTQIISKLVSRPSAQCWHHFLCSAGILAFNPPLNKMPEGDHSVLLFCNLTASHPAPVARVFTDLRLQNLLVLPEDLGQSQCMFLSGYFWTPP